jgi:predicted anti-sigma-YlaC factor YlaD
MANTKSKVMDCTAFEERLSDYLEHTVEKDIRKSMAAHALSCPLCHSLMNEVKNAIAACRQVAEPKPALTRLDAQILARTMPAAAINCDEFEAYLTDYLDGFLPANVFHRWERHAVLCNDCTDLPGEVVRSLAALISYKSENCRCRSAFMSEYWSARWEQRGRDLQRLRGLTGSRNGSADSAFLSRFRSSPRSL